MRTTWGGLRPVPHTDAEAVQALSALSFGPLWAHGRSPGRILADADDLERDGHRIEARRDRREAAAVLWAWLRHADQRPPGVSRRQARAWILRVTAHPQKGTATTARVSRSARNACP